MNVKTLVSVVALATVFVAGTAQARISNRDGYTEDAKVSRTITPYQDGARVVESSQDGSRPGDRWALRQNGNP